MCCVQFFVSLLLLLLYTWPLALLTSPLSFSYFCRYLWVSRFTSPTRIASSQEQAYNWLGFIKKDGQRAIQSVCMCMCICVCPPSVSVQWITLLHSLDTERVILMAAVCVLMAIIIINSLWWKASLASAGSLSLSLFTRADIFSLSLSPLSALLLSLSLSLPPSHAIRILRISLPTKEREVPLTLNCQCKRCK